MMKNLLIATMTTMLAVSADASDLVFRSGTRRTHLIELYSSEGCSSCPPADAWVSSLRTSQNLWKDFIPAVFHVTYWDNLGWTDRLANAAFTARQRAYAASWGIESVYTPGLVLDGAEWRDWGHEPPASDETDGALEASVIENRVHVSFTAPAEKGPYDVYGARLGFGISSHVANGENSGRMLRHDFVAGGMVRISLKDGNGAWSGEFSLPDPPRLPAAQTGLAVWVVDRDGRPVQATGGFLH
jgi:hypothetical protein